MHADQLDVGVETVSGLVAAQFPQWAQLTPSPLNSHGTVNALFRLGDDVVLRFPLLPSLDDAFRAELVREQEIVQRLAPQLPLAIPEPLAIGEPGAGYPGPWTAYRWIDGQVMRPDIIDDADEFARDLAGFVVALHGIDTAGQVSTGSGRGGPLHQFDGHVRTNLGQSAHLTDTVTLARLWATCLAAERHTGPDVWVHADLMPGNLLVRDGRLAAVIDFETLRIGDPAVDLMPAWNLLEPRPRASYRRALDVDDAAWERGRGWAIIQAIGALPYYVDTNPVMAQTARHTLDAVIAG